MSHENRFDFLRESQRIPQALTLIRDFASATAYRSATVYELQLDGSEHRRPLRVEDLDFLKFNEAVKDTTVSMLPALATNRMLFCLNERLGEVRATQVAREQTPEEQQLRSFLESVAFNFVDRNARTAGTDSISGAELIELFDTRSAGYKSLLDRLDKRSFVREGLGFTLLQHCAPQEVATVATRRAMSATRLCAHLEISAPIVEPPTDVSSFLTQLAAKMGLSPVPHAHWQFYLATSLSRVNLLCALALRREDALSLLGAAYALEADLAAFSAFAVNATRLLGEIVDSPSLDATPPRRATFDRTLAKIRQHCGESGLKSFQLGFAYGREISDAAFRDLSRQLDWLSNIDSFQVAAELITSRIELEWPEIDRDTFVEPREMCSTTHVHDDHRLVTVESGDMIFWGRPGMELTLTTNDKVLIPAGRLHGSTVTSPSCTYHQPIIPDQWVRDAFGLIRTNNASNAEHVR